MGKRGFVAGVVVLTLALGACGGGGNTVSPTQYASTVCGSLKSWLLNIRAQSTKVKTAVEPGSTPKQGQDALRSYLDTAIATTNTMISAIKGAGTPDVPNGSTLSSKLVAALEATQTAFQSARSQVDSLPTNSRHAFEVAAKRVGDQITGKVGSIGQSFQGLNSPELERAFTQAPACRST